MIDENFFLLLLALAIFAGALAVMGALADYLEKGGNRMR